MKARLFPILLCCARERLVSYAGQSEGNTSSELLNVYLQVL